MNKLIGVLAGLLLLLPLSANAKQDYVLGAGDMVKISVYGNPDLATETRVTAAGTITFPLLGDVQVGGMTTGDAEKKIATAMEQGGFLKQPQINIVVLKFQSQMVSVLGDVYRPGSFPLDRPSTLGEILAMAGGVTASGSDMVSVTRVSEGKAERFEYDLREWRDRGQVAHNPMMRGDETVFVHSREISVLGQVNRPGKYSLTSNVRNVVDFIAMAGGITVNGADRVVVLTSAEGKPARHELDLDQLFRSGSTVADIELRSGDVVYVPRYPQFYIYGEVQRPGAYRLERNMTVAQALALGGGLSLRGTEKGLIIKRPDASGVVQTLEPNAADTLQADDVIQVRESLF
jgi:polysaccharide export outer membrane protein